MRRGLRNCNPGNIRASPVRYRGEVVPSQDPEFKQFETMAWGYRALFVLLDTYRSRYGLETLRRMIARYAPPSENDTERYVRCVVEWSGVDADAPLDTRCGATMRAVAAAFARMENGVAADPGEVEAGWALFAADAAAR